MNNNVLDSQKWVTLMAKRKFVSSKKNAPSRTISSKEAALHCRTGSRVGVESQSSNSVASSDVESSTPLSSEYEQEDDDDLNVTQSVTPQPMAVEVMPATVGRGKQLRFPTALSRGKVLPAEGGVASDGDHDSDDESLLSVADSDDDDQDRGETAMEIEEEPTVATPPIHIESLSMTNDVKSFNKDAPAYPIKAVRARKRHRPDSEYYKQMSTYVRDCLLSVRHGSNSDTLVDAFKDDSSSRHDEFRRRLTAGEVERVTWKEPPSVESGSTVPHDASSSKTTKSSKSSKMSKSSRLSKQSNSSKPSKSNSKSKTLASDSRDAITNKSIPLLSNGSANHLTPPTQPTAPVAPSAPAMCEICKKKLSGETSKEDEEKQERSLKMEKDVKVEEVKQPLEEVKLPLEEVKEEPSPQALTPFVGHFTITFSPGSDAQNLRLESAKLMNEARKLKHEGNRRGSSERGSGGHVTQGKYYLRSGAKFFEYALKLQEVKMAYQEKGDVQHARTFGENCVTTLSQTSSLIESTIRAFQSAGSMRLAALGCKMAAVVHLTVYRLQHRKLQSFYSELFTPGRSPESRENGLTPPIDPTCNLNGNSSKDAAMCKHLLKEMEHTLRGFEMWRRYESYKVSVLPRVTNPVIIDPAVFFEDFEAEFNLS
ncbi:hypothetical protein KXD40_008209 [Peronospora effusa]|uniref:Uncharacterized protein n=1 Tax=Peronospora effusa TaxID=542832 RepID=A0A3M6VBX8_9STRA|nr:hypothetical protein DD238_004328 [Peronospora effusa]RQM17092.1 hypothetical protein DD237_001168 [Peronospora effusa]UIZ24016.1 hypothetical protein KXD40_008209 [Peronospora effusa]